MEHEILLAPLQSLTDYRFRNAFQAYFGGIDMFYSPWIRLTHQKTLKNSHIIDVQPENNKNYPVVPQIMTDNAEDFIFLSKYLADLGHEEINWNMGCPYPMVAKRGMGSGLLCNPTHIVQVLEDVLPKLSTKLSIKMRLGYDDANESARLMPYLNDFPLTEIQIHARSAKQMYKGVPDYQAFQDCVDASTHQMVYNGDINDLETFNGLTERFPTIRRWMLGRGVIANPFLPQQLKNNTTDLPDDAVEIFEKFHSVLFDNYQRQLSGDKHLLLKMTSFWEYFARTYDDPHKVYKRIKKAKSIRAYDDAVRVNMRLFAERMEA